VALARILVDGYSLLHHWQGLAPGVPRHTAAAREELIHVLTRYHDACGTPVTIVFDGSRPARGGEETPSTPEVEILYSRGGQTADQLIERAAHRLQPYGEVLVVMNMGSLAASCENFVRTVESALNELSRDLKQFNQRERSRFQRR
jgi:predicted RNA-binding protein with PIN domain